MHLKPVAIVGAACRFPGANSLKQFWHLLSSARHAVNEIPNGRWSKSRYYHPKPGEPGKSYTWAAGVIDGIDLFDADFFGMSPREAEQVDPQQRLLLELAWEALEDAGIPASAIAGSHAGVYVGASSRDYADIRIGDKLAFVFSGNGSQWPGMARDALTLNGAFRRAVERLDDMLRPLLGWSVIAVYWLTRDQDRRLMASRRDATDGRAGLRPVRASGRQNQTRKARDE